MALLTYSELISQITSRLNRDDLDAKAREFAVDRVDFYKKECFYSGQVINDSISTVAGTTFYNIPDGWEQVHTVKYLLGSVWVELVRQEHRILDNLDNLEPALRSIPALWSTYNNRIRLYPTPGAIYQLELVMDLPPDLPADNAGNFWTGDAKSLVIAGTCAEICEFHINDPDRGSRFRTAEEREMIAMHSKTIRHRGGIKVRPYI